MIPSIDIKSLHREKPGNGSFAPSKSTRDIKTPMGDKHQHTKSHNMVMMSSGGDAGFDFRFENRSNKSGRSGGPACTGGVGSHSVNGDDNNLLELMVM
jgi:hypothetical protein